MVPRIRILTMIGTANLTIIPISYGTKLLKVDLEILKCYKFRRKEFRIYFLAA